MNQPLQPTPTLLSIAAAPADTGRGSKASDGFADELSSASSRSERPREASQATKRETAPTEAKKTNRSDDTEPAEVIENEVTEEAPVYEEAADEDGLLSVTVATETLVVETPPTAQLPEEAATQIDVAASPEVAAGVEPIGFEGLAAKLGVTPADAVLAEESAPAAPTTGEASLTSVIGSSEGDAESDAEPTLRAEPESSGDLSTDDGRLGDRPLSTGATGVSEGEEVGVGRQQAVSDNAAPSEEGALKDAAPEVESLTTKASATPPSIDATPPTEGDNATPTRDSAPSVPTASQSGVERADASPRLANQPADSLPPIDPARFVSRVARAFDFAQERGGGPVEMRLSPPELGSLRVTIELKEGVLTAALEAETPAARQTLLDNLPALRDRLEQQQIRIEKFDVDVRDDSQQRGDDWQQGNQRQNRDGADSHRREPPPDTLRPTEATTDSVPTSETSTIHFGADEINLVA